MCVSNAAALSLDESYNRRACAPESRRNEGANEARLQGRVRLVAGDRHAGRHHGRAVARARRHRTAGITVVAGNEWLQQDVADALRAVERLASPTLSACMRARDRFPFVAGTDQCRLELYGALVLFRGGAR